MKVRGYLVDLSAVEDALLSCPELSAAACVVADLNRDRKPDIACIGAATQNLVLYTQK